MAYATSSFNDLTGRFWRTTSTCGADRILATGAKSLTGSHDRFFISSGVITWKPEYCSISV
ncbi:hypothetical protein D3C81_1710210 [compost metagenome]